MRSCCEKLMSCKLALALRKMETDIKSGEGLQTSGKKQWKWLMHSLCVMRSMSLALQPFAVRAQMGSWRADEVTRHQQSRKEAAGISWVFLFFWGREGRNLWMFGVTTTTPRQQPVMSPAQGDSSSSRAPERSMLRRRRTSRDQKEGSSGSATRRKSLRVEASLVGPSLLVTRSYL